MTTHRAPRRLFDEFEGANEEKKERLRFEVVQWMQTLDLKLGDTVVSPHPDTGLEQSFVVYRRRNN